MLRHVTVDVVFPHEPERCPRVRFEYEEHGQVEAPVWSMAFLPQVRQSAVPALIEEFLFLITRHGPREAAAFLRRMENVGASLPEPTLF